MFDIKLVDYYFQVCYNNALENLIIWLYQKGKKNVATKSIDINRIQRVKSGR